VKKTLRVTAASLAMLLAVAGVAGANSILIPFFGDDAEPPPPYSAGLAAFIQLMNVEEDPIVVMVEYFDPDGVDGTPGECTFELSGRTAISFRPVQNDEALEGEAGAAVPDALPVGKLGEYATGGATISATGRIVGAAVGYNYYRNMSYAYPAFEIPEEAP